MMQKQKKAIFLLATVSLLLAVWLYPAAGGASAAGTPPNLENALFYIGGGGTVNSYHVEEGQISVNVTLNGKDSYLQFKQPVTDLIGREANDSCIGNSLNINLDGHELGQSLGTTDAEIATNHPALWNAYTTAGTYEIKVGLTSDQDGSNSTLPASWTLYPGSGGQLGRPWVLNNAPKGSANNDLLFKFYREMMANGYGYTLNFHSAAGGNIYLGPTGGNAGRIEKFTSAFAPASKSELYVRVGLSFGTARTLNIQLNSDDFRVVYDKLTLETMVNILLKIEQQPESPVGIVDLLNLKSRILAENSGS